MYFRYSDRILQMKSSIIREILKQMNTSDLISFAGGNPDATAFPVAEIEEISAKLLQQEPVPTLQYSVTDGYPGLLIQGEKYVNQFWPVKKDGDGMMVASGSQQIMDILAKLLCNKGDVVATEDPAFLGALASFRGYEAKLVGVEMEQDGVNLAALEAVLSAPEKPKLYYTIPNFQNPTGITTSLAKRKAVYELCKKHGVPILEDNPYGELRISGEDIPPIKSFDEEGLVVYAASLSKIFAPGLRVAFCVAPKELLTKMVTAKQSVDVHTNIWAQRVCEAFFREKDMNAHITRLRGIYREKANCMTQELDRCLAGRVGYQKPEGGMFIWLTLPEEVPMREFVQNCLQEKLAVVPGNAFYVDEDAACHSVRINFSTPTKEQIVTGVEIMEKVLNTMQGR